MRRSLVLVLVLVLVLPGCGGERKTDTAAFTRAAKTPTERSILSTIATYRTTKDEARACSLLTRHFVSGRFEGKIRNCKQVQRQADRFLPDSAKLQSATGGTARVLVDEPTATESIYLMRLDGGTWKIDDILDAPKR